MYHLAKETPDIKSCTCEGLYPSFGSFALKGQDNTNNIQDEMILKSKKKVILTAHSITFG